MFLKLNHKNLDVYKHSIEFTIQAYAAAKQLPTDERFNMIQQIRRAALSVTLNISEGASRKSALERKRFFEISRSSLVEVDTAFEVANRLNYLTNINTESLNKSVNKVFSMLSVMLR